MADFSDIITLQLVADGPGVERADFGTALLLSAPGDLPAGFTQRLRYYNSARDVSADATLGASGATAAVQEIAAALRGAFAQSPTPSRVALGRRDTAEAAAAALDAIRAESNGWFGLASKGSDAADSKLIADWAEANKKVFTGQSNNADNLTVDSGSLIELIDTNNYRYAAAVYHPTATEYVAFWWLCANLAVNMDSNSTTWAFQTIAGAAPAVLTTTQRNAIEAANGNYYGTGFGRPGMFPGNNGNGEDIERTVITAWIDDRGAAAMAAPLFDASNRGSRVPQTQEGYEIMRGALATALRGGERAGHFAQGSTVVTIPTQTQANIDANRVGLDFEVVGAGTIKGVQIVGTFRSPQIQ